MKFVPQALLVQAAHHDDVETQSPNTGCLEEEEKTSLLQEQGLQHQTQEKWQWRLGVGCLVLWSIVVTTKCHCHQSASIDIEAEKVSLHQVMVNEHSGVVADLSVSSIVAEPSAEADSPTGAENALLMEDDDENEREQEHGIKATAIDMASSRHRRSLDTIDVKVVEKPGYKHAPWYFSDSYLPRAQVKRQNNRAMIKQWGSWTLEPPTDVRPNLDRLYSKYPNRDVPRKAFPATAWQKDQEYVKSFLEQGIALTERALLAILAEYGHYTPGKKTSVEDALADAEKTDPAYMFNLTVLPGGIGYPRAIVGNGGYASPTALARLRRQLLHAIMTEDQFSISMGGHSSSAGHGNHFAQSYALQTQVALEPVLARLGVFHFTRNIGMGGLGTIHNALASQSIYGGDNDILIWDSSMTEGHFEPRDLFARQGLLGGTKVPLLWGAPVMDIYDRFGEAGVIETGSWGTGTAGIPRTETLQQVEMLPYATQFVECSKEMFQECRSHEYNGVCWIDRPEVTPFNKQSAVMGGRAKWHPGHRIHLLKSRIIAFSILKVLRQALLDWYHTENYALPDAEWHVTKEYARIRRAVLNETETECTQLALPNFTCNVPLYGRSEFTPRAYPASTSIRSILRPEVKVSGPEPNVYDPPDVFNPNLHPPDGAIDYLAIVESGVEFAPLPARRKYLMQQWKPPRVRHAAKSSLVPGQGWNSITAAAADNCDGTYESFCNRGNKSDCLLYGHNDFRGMLVGDAVSGWLLMSLNDMKHGFIMILGSQYPPYFNVKTKGWKCENNAQSCEKPLSDKDANADFSVGCHDYTFEFAINGKITVWSAKEFKAQIKEPSRLISLSVLLDDRSFVPDGKSMDVELGIRISGNCGRASVLQISHVYWA